MKKWLLISMMCALAFAGVIGVQAQDPAAGAAALCENVDDRTGGSIVVTGGLDNIFDEVRSLTGSTYCRVVVYDSQVQTTLAEIGNLEVIQRGVIQAVDLVGMLPEGETWNSFRTPARVCLRGDGDIHYINEQDAARTVRTLTPVTDGGIEGFTCAEINNSGMVMLTPDGPDFGSATTVGADGTTTFPSTVPAADPNAVTELDNCQVTTKVKGVFIRRGPSTNDRIRWQLENDQTLNATGIAGEWYRINFRNSPGWIAAAFVHPIGNCLAPDGSVVGTDDPFAPGDAETYYGLTDCQITTNFNGVNLRREPSINASIRWTFEDSQELEAVGVTGNWFLIAFRGSPGWLHASGVSAVGECAQPVAEEVTSAE